jgi:site-specific recombinase XerD
MMKKTRPNLLARQLQDFFTNHMPKLRGISPNTILSYRDALVLFLRFVTSQTKRPVVELDIEDLTPQIVGMFLIHLERDRGNSAATRNVRLSAIHSFFRFVAAQCPEQIEQAQRVLTVPFKKTKTRVIEYLEYDEIQEVLSAVDRATSKGRRDYALLATMFNTGARVQEILNITARDLQLTKPFHVRLFAVVTNRQTAERALHGIQYCSHIRYAHIPELPRIPTHSIRSPLYFANLFETSSGLDCHSPFETATSTQHPAQHRRRAPEVWCGSLDHIAVVGARESGNNKSLRCC